MTSARQRLEYAAWGMGEFASAGLAIGTGRVNSGPQRMEIAARVATLAGARAAYAVNAGRTAIWLVLTAMRELVPGRDRVVIPAYLCPGVADAVERAGLSWTVADVGDELNVEPETVQARLDGRTLAVIVPHMYGCPARVSEIEGICRAAGVFMIDDAAQVVGVEQAGRMLGSFGDAGILSFAQSKCVVTGIRGSGGVLLVNNPELQVVVQRLFGRLPDARGRLTQFVYFVVRYLMRLRTASYYIDRAAQRLAGGGGADYYLPARIGNLDAAVALAQLDHLDSLREARVRLAERIVVEARRIEGVVFPQYAAGRYLSRLMAAVPEGMEANRVRSHLRRAGMATPSPYPLLDPEGSHSRKARAWARRLIELPARSGMSSRDIRAVCGALADGLAAQRAIPRTQHPTEAVT